MREALSTILFLVLIFYSYATHEDAAEAESSQEDKLKSNIVSDIIQKVTNLTTNEFSNVSPEEKRKKLTIIKEKLMKASSFKGSNAIKYVDLVMEGVEAIAAGAAKPDESRRAATSIPQIETKSQGKSKKFLKKHSNEKDKSIKNKLVRSIAKKVETLTKVAFYKAKTREEKEKIMENIKNRLIEAAKKHKVMIRSENNSIKPYSELVIEGVELALQKKYHDDTERRTSVEVKDVRDGPFLRSSKIEETSGNENVEASDVNQTINSIDQLQKTYKLDLCNCDCVIERTCAKISALNTFTCSQDKKSIPLDKICDGIPDCIDESDEKECAKNAIMKLQNASRLLSEIEALIPRRCLKTTLEQKILTTQNAVLTKVLKEQTEFIKKNNPTKDRQFLKFNNDQIKGVVNDVGRIVSTVGYALEGAFCVHEGDENVFSRRALTVVEEDMNEITEDNKSWAPPLCACKEEFCSKSNCTPSCQRTCWQRYSLGQWVCEATSGNATVSLEVICDGKVDCYDESDELGCSSGKSGDKIEARKLFDIILKILSSKIALKEFHPVFNKLNALQELIKKLQKASAKDTANVLAVKSLRDKCFSELISIYDEVLKNADDIEEVLETYLLLISLNEYLISALKRSQTGNDKIVSTQECLCRDDHCAVTSCSPTCLRACSVKPKLTKYSCNTNSNTTNNTTKNIHIDNICNGKPDCPNGDDEENCKDDICRNHHLMLLRNEVQNIHIENGLIADILKAWKTKIIAKLLVLEKRGRSTRRVLQKVVGEVLQDLTMAYASLGEYRRNISEENVDKFSAVAHRIREMLRSCTK